MKFGQRLYYSTMTLARFFSNLKIQFCRNQFKLAIHVYVPENIYKIGKFTPSHFNKIWPKDPL